jgi:hypothetical protein
VVLQDRLPAEKLGISPQRGEWRPSLNFKVVGVSFLPVRQERWEASMLAEIILLRLEIAIRLAEQASGQATPRFVPLQGGMKPRFKTQLAAV